MKKLIIFILVLSLNACVAAKKEQTNMYGDKLGTVRVPITCSQEGYRLVERGVALLHHMTYNGARSAFVAA